jgi:stage II sporulation protein E
MLVTYLTPAFRKGDIGEVLNKVEVTTYRRLNEEEDKNVYIRALKVIPHLRGILGGIRSALWSILEKEKLVVYLCGFFLGRMVIFGEFSPFILPYFIAVAIKGDMLRTIITGGVLITGYLSTHGSLDMYGASTLFLTGGLMALLITNLSEKAKKRGTGIAFLTFFIYFVTRLICGFFLGLPSPNFLLLLIEAFFTALLTLVFIFGIRPIDKSGRYTFLTKEELAGLVILGAGVIAGLPNMSIGSFSLNDVILKLVIMALTFAGGISVGTMAGVGLGLLFAMVNPTASPLIVGLYACGGLIAGMFRDYGKPGIALGLFLGNALLSFQFTTANAMISSFGGTGLAAAGFALMPRGCLSSLERYITNPSDKLKREAAYQKKLRNVVSERLEDFSNIFTELARTFDSVPCAVSQGPQRGDVISLLKLLSQRACQGCSGYHVCWEKNFHQTYKELIELLILAERKSGISGTDLPSELRKRCIQGYKLISSINYIVEICQSDKYWKERLSESQGMVSDQLKGVARLMGQLSNEVTIDADFKEEMELRISSKLKTIGIPVTSITALSMGHQEVEVTICKKRCRGERECTNKIAPLVSNLLGRGFAVWKGSCALETGCGECEFRLLPARSFELEIEILKASKDDAVVSGDNHSIIELKDGKVAIILSDGMGTGHEAALESGATVAMMERLINAGFDSDFAIRTINSILLLRSAEENFATVDMALMDLYTGNTEFVKIGAAPTFIKRGRHIDLIRGTSLPIGILNSVRSDRENRRLMDGDILVMITDGIMDSCKDLTEREEWVGHTLARIDSRDTKEIARYLLRAARERGGGRCNDDMTVIVAKAKNKFSAYNIGN